jgi:HEAT repeat protein
MHSDRLRSRPCATLATRALWHCAWSAALVLGAGACASTETKDPTLAEQAGVDGEPYVPIEARGANAERSLGKYLADLDNAIRAWMEKTWTASSVQDAQKQDRLEMYLETESRRRKADLLEQLETGPLKNRIVAATALGFTRDPAALSPLLAALEDAHPQVVQNALIGLSLLQSPDTPLEPVIERMRYAEEPALRGSAAYCLRCLMEAGARGGDAAGAARGGVVDPDPIVRSQSALILALLKDPDAVDPLALLLADDVELVIASAARGLSYLGREVDSVKGRCARALTDVLADAESPTRRAVITRNLMLLGEKNYGDDDEAWTAWSHRLP